MSEEEMNENQMGLFEILGDPLVAPTAPQSQPQPDLQPKLQPKPKAKPQAATSRPAAPPAAAKSAAKRGKAAPATAAPAPKKISGLVPTGDVRLTANIRQDLHLKLKIASAYRRTTIGEIIEELIEQHI